MKSDAPFFIGFLRPPEGLRLFLVLVALASLVGFGAGAYFAAATQNDPGDGRFRFDLGRQTLTGVLEARPYPMLHILHGEHGTAGRSILLSGVGKRGVIGRAAPLDGQLVTASGVLLTRGDIFMLQVRGADDGLVAAEGDGAVPAAELLGKWRLTGEICDGKCYNGAMRPGTGLAHKACANLCIAGGVPPVLVTTGTVEGTDYFALGSADGGPIPDWVLNYTAGVVTLDGVVERRGDLAVFLADFGTMERAQ